MGNHLTKLKKSKKTNDLSFIFCGEEKKISSDFDKMSIGLFLY